MCAIIRGYHVAWHNAPTSVTIWPIFGRCGALHRTRWSARALPGAKSLDWKHGRSPGGAEVLSTLSKVKAFAGELRRYSVRALACLIDLDDNDLFDTADYVTVRIGGNPMTVPVSGLASKVGIIKTPTVISAGETFQLASGTTGKIASVQEKGGGSSFGRVSWQELFAD